MSNRVGYLLIIFIFVLVGLLHISPDLRLIFDLGGNFKGIPFLAGGDDTVYLSRIAAVMYKGDLRLANPSVYEHQNDPALMPAMAEVIEGSIGRWLGLKLWQVDLLATFLLPVALCFIIYLLVYQLTSSFKIAILTALGVVLGYYWFTPNLKAIFALSRDHFSASLLFVRPISPQFHFIPFMLSLYLISKLMDRENYYLAILSGLVVGLLFYGSVFYWTFIYAGLGILLIIDLFRGKTQRLKQYFLTFVLSILVGIPYWISYKPLTNLSNFDEIFRRQGGIYTHAPYIPGIELAFLIFLVLMRYLFKEKKKQLYYMISFVAGGLICLNQQVVTGKTIQPVHWHILTNKVFLIICIFACFAFVLERLGRVKKYKVVFGFLRRNSFFYLACFILLLMGIIQQDLNYSARKGLCRKLQTLGPVLDYIHTSLPLEAVILTNPFRMEDEQMISVITKNYTYISGSFFISSVMSNEEIRNRYLSALHFYGYTPLQAEDLFRFMNGGLFRGMQVHPLYGGTKEDNDAYIEGLKRDYAQVIKEDPVNMLEKYKVDYVLIGEEDKSRLLLNKRIAKILKLEYIDNSYSLYKIEE